MWHKLGDQAWDMTPLGEIRIDVHLNDGITTMPLTMLVDIIYPLIHAKVGQALTVELRSVTAPDGKQIAKLILPEPTS
jgi:hypothetical protein